MPVRVECTAEGFERCWVEVTERWTQRETVEMMAVADDAFYAMLSRKLIACHIETTTGSIDRPEDITADNLLDADVEVIGWLGVVMPLAVARRRTLGNASARLSLSGKDKPTTTAALTPT